MFFAIVVPETLTASASDVARIGSSLSTANAAAAAPTIIVLTAAADEVSAAIATLFGAHAQEYQRSSARRRRPNASPLQTVTAATQRDQCAGANPAGAPVVRQWHQWGAWDGAERWTRWIAAGQWR